MSAVRSFLHPPEGRGLAARPRRQPSRQSRLPAMLRSQRRCARRASHSLASHTRKRADRTLPRGVSNSFPEKLQQSLPSKPAHHAGHRRGLPHQGEHVPGEVTVKAVHQSPAAEAMSQGPEGEPLGSTSCSPAGQQTKSWRVQETTAPKPRPPAGRLVCNLPWEAVHRPLRPGGATCAEGSEAFQRAAHPKVIEQTLCCNATAH